MNWARENMRRIERVQRRLLEPAAARGEGAAAELLGHQAKEQVADADRLHRQQVAVVGQLHRQQLGELLQQAARALRRDVAVTRLVLVQALEEVGLRQGGQAQVLRHQPLAQRGA